MKNIKKAIALLLSILMILAVAPVSVFAEDAGVVVEEDVLDTDADASASELNGFTLIGGFFETLANMLRLVVQFLENMAKQPRHDMMKGPGHGMKKGCKAPKGDACPQKGGCPKAPDCKKDCPKKK